MAARGDDQWNQRDQRTMGSGQVGGGIEEAGKQHHEQQRGNQHLVARVLDHELVGQPHRTGERCDHCGHHDNLADGCRHGWHPVFVLETVVTKRQVHAPAFRRHDLQFVFKVFSASREISLRLVKLLITA